MKKPESIRLCQDYCRRLLFVIGIVLLPCIQLESNANVRMADIFGDHMVLQRGIEIPVWGWADSGEKIRLMLNGQTVTVKTDKTGMWKANFSPMKAGGPYEMTIQGKNEIILSDILIGDVWLCGGQSNMEMPISGFTGQPITNADRELQNANYNSLRLITVERNMSTVPADSFESSGWKSAIGENIADFSAVGYFFGKEIFLDQNVPIGLVSVNWGGTNCETWTSTEALIEDPDFGQIVQDMQKSGMRVEDYLAKNSESFNKWLEKVMGSDEGFKEGWMNQEEIPGNWPKMVIPGLWENQGHEGFDGAMWFTREVILPETYAGRELTIRVGKIDDSDRTYFNGVKIGGLDNQWNKRREYKIPGSIVKEGKNSITIRVFDTGGGGGINGNPDDLVLQLTDSNKTIPLSGEWSYQIGYKMDTNPPSINFGPNSKPTLLFNGMLSPLIPFGIKGAIWYQGESNASRAYQYRRLFPLMIEDWREQWEQGNFPFLFVQLAAYHPVDDDPVESAWAELREAQRMTLSLPNTGMAVAIDIGEADNIHPANKEEVGKRLALAAKEIAYHQELVFQGPLFQTMELVGDEIKVSFSHIGSGLIIKDKYGYLKGFTLAGKDKKFQWAKARIEGNSVFVYHPAIKDPVAVRYAWYNNPEDANLYNMEGLPASPFRTDDWDGITKGKK